MGWRKNGTEGIDVIEWLLACEKKGPIRLPDGVDMKFLYCQHSPIQQLSLK